MADSGKNNDPSEALESIVGASLKDSSLRDSFLKDSSLKDSSLRDRFDSMFSGKRQFVEGHAYRVATIALDIANQAKAPSTLYDKIANAALLHDIGSIAEKYQYMQTRIKDNLDLPGWKEIFARVKTHGERGAGIGYQYELPNDVLDSIRHHHDFQGRYMLTQIIGTAEILAGSLGHQLYHDTGINDKIEGLIQEFEHMDIHESLKTVVVKGLRENRYALQHDEATYEQFADLFSGRRIRLAQQILLNMINQDKAAYKEKFEIARQDVLNSTYLKRIQRDEMRAQESLDKYMQFLLDKFVECTPFERAIMWVYKDGSHVDEPKFVETWKALAERDGIDFDTLYRRGKKNGVLEVRYASGLEPNIREAYLTKAFSTMYDLESRVEILDDKEQPVSKALRLGRPEVICKRLNILPGKNIGDHVRDHLIKDGIAKVESHDVREYNDLYAVPIFTSDGKGSRKLFGAISADCENFRYLIGEEEVMIGEAFAKMAANGFSLVNDIFNYKSILEVQADPLLIEEAVKSGPSAFKTQEIQGSYLFGDVCGFTAASARYGPDKIVELVNDIFERVCPYITKSMGIVDKFVGDLVMGVWGWPRAHDSDAHNAVLTAICMQWELYKLHQEKAPLGEPSLDMSIGINSGPANWCAIGWEKKKPQTVMGDAVNMASRLETAAGTSQIFIGEPTYKQVVNYLNSMPASTQAWDKFPAEIVVKDPINVKGKEEKIPLYEVRPIFSKAEPYIQK